MKKKAVSVLLVAAMAATMMAGCGSKAGSGAGTESGSASKGGDDKWSGTITVWSPQEDQDTGW